MWAPANIYDIPTDEDRAMAKEALIELRRDLEDAVEHLDHARVDHLRRNIAEREAWLAPMIGGHQWTSQAFVASGPRAAILATHRAWTFIDLNDGDSSRFLPLFLKRSGHRGLHVGLQRMSNGEDFATVAQMADRIQCLSIPHFQKQLRGVKFPLLRRLRISKEASVEPLLQLSTTQFPQLHHLEYAYYYTPTNLTSVRAVLGFPALQSLRLVGSALLPLSNILSKCSASLRSLEMSINDATYFPQQYIIMLPRLETLVFYDRTLGTIRNPPEFVTPALKTLKIGSLRRTDKFPLQMDLGMLEHVQTEYRQIPPLSALHGIRVLQVHISKEHLSKLLKTLALDSSTCPRLEIVEYNSEDFRDSDKRLIDEMLLEVKETYGRDLPFVEAASFSLPLSGYIEETCGLSMPCTT